MATKPQIPNKLIGILLVVTIAFFYLGIMFFLVPLSGNKGIAQWLNSKRILEDHKKDLTERITGNEGFKNIDLDLYIKETQELVKMGDKSFNSWLSFRTFTPNISGKYIQTNDFGLRTNIHLMEMIQKAQHNKKTGGKNIIVLGGSTAFGYGVAEERNTITGNLNSQLKEKGYAVFNLAQGGYTSFMELFIFSVIGIYLEPDILIIMDGFADTYHLAYKPKQEQLPLGPWSGSKKGDEPGFILDFYYKNLEAICKLADAGNKKVILALQPISGFENNSRLDTDLIKEFWALYPKVREVSKLVAKNQNATFVDLSVLYKEEESSEENFFDKSHLSTMGQKKVAAALIEAIAATSSSPKITTFIPLEDRESLINNIIGTNFRGSYKTAEDY